MDVEDCIQQYWIMSVRIFSPRRMRLIHMYSRKALQDSAKAVVHSFCGCQNTPARPCHKTHGHELFRQYDFEEAFEQGPHARTNKTCKV